MDMGTPIVDPWAGGVTREDLGVVLIGDGTGNTPFGVRNVVDNPPYGKEPGVGSTTGWRDWSWVNSAGNNLMGVFINHPGGCDEWGRAGVTVDLYFRKEEHGFPVSCSSEHSEPLTGDREASEGKDGKRWREQEGLSLSGVQGGPEVRGIGGVDG